MPKFLTLCFDRGQANADFIPKELWDLKNPVDRIFVQGRESALSLLTRLPFDGLAVVGTRAPQMRSVQLVSRALADLKGSNLIIISGFARGIDSAAHEGALASDLPTVAVLGTGIDRTYPPENQGLREEILAKGGLIVSEFEPTDHGLPGYFIKRNQMIAGWARATWVVEAAHRSGALNTAKWARIQDRPVLATPCFPGDPALAGNQVLIDRDHATAFWGAGSVGTVWLELSSHKPEQTAILFPRGGDPDCQSLVERLKEQMSVTGGAEVTSMLDWAIGKGWTPQKFFAVAQLAIRSGRVEERAGLWISKEI